MIKLWTVTVLYWRYRYLWRSSWNLPFSFEVIFRSYPTSDSFRLTLCLSLSFSLYLTCTHSQRSLPSFLPIPSRPLPPSFSYPLNRPFPNLSPRRLPSLLSTTSTHSPLLSFSIYSHALLTFSPSYSHSFHNTSFATTKLFRNKLRLQYFSDRESVKCCDYLVRKYPEENR